MAATSTARAHWEGDLQNGSGTVTTDGPALDSTELTWRSRIGEQPGTTPEELLASAWAGCFSMALSGALGKAGHPPRALDVSATLTFGPQDGGFAIQRGALRLEADVPGMDEQALRDAAQDAKAGCPVSKALGSLASEAELDVQLVSAAR